MLEPDSRLEAADALFKKGPQPGKTAECHRPPGDPDNVRIIHIVSDDVADHMAHGDHSSFDGFCSMMEKEATPSSPAGTTCPRSPR